MHARTHTHLLHRSCHCWKHRQKASFGIFRSSAFAFDLMSSMVAKRVPLRPIFGVGKSEKSLRARSGECGGWVMIGMLAWCSSGGNGTTSGRESSFCTTMTHRATHRLLCSNSSPRETFLSSPIHRTLQITLWVTFGSFLLWKWAARGRVSQRWRTSNRMRWPNSRRFQRSLPMVLPTMAGSREQLCVHAKILLWGWLGKRCHMYYHYSAIPYFRELFDCPPYTETNIWNCICHKPGCHGATYVQLQSCEW